MVDMLAISEAAMETQAPTLTCFPGARMCDNLWRGSPARPALLRAHRGPSIGVLRGELRQCPYERHQCVCVCVLHSLGTTNKMYHTFRPNTWCCHPPNARKCVNLRADLLHGAPCPELQGEELVAHLAVPIAAVAMLAIAETAKRSSSAPTLGAVIFQGRTSVGMSCGDRLHSMPCPEVHRAGAGRSRRHWSPWVIS